VLQLRIGPVAFASVVALAVVASSTESALALAPVNQTWRGVAIDGYDPVAYFTEGRPVEGSSEHALEWMGATWRFASVGNRARFAADPERFAPRYGGYCAWAVSQGRTADVDPEAWSIVDGRLYLNYSLDVQATWEADRASHIRQADENWPKLLRGGP
jgi:hypothetical protein